MRKFPNILLAALVLVGCGASSAEKPANAAPIVRDSAPTKVPSTPEEKIAAIQKAPMSEEQKKAAIERVRSGKL